MQEKLLAIKEAAFNEIATAENSSKFTFFTKIFNSYFF